MLYAPHCLGFCTLLKISSGNPCLKIISLAKLFVADAPKKKKLKNLVLPPLKAIWNMGRKAARDRGLRKSQNSACEKKKEKKRKEREREKKKIHYLTSGVIIVLETAALFR